MCKKSATKRVSIKARSSKKEAQKEAQKELHKELRGLSLREQAQHKQSASAQGIELPRAKRDRAKDAFRSSKKKKARAALKESKPLSGKTLTVGIPCYNSAEYMDHAISSLLEGSNFADDLEVIIVDDGSTKDNTWEKAQEWEARYPHLIKAIHQENGGHGIAVKTALEHAQGVYIKICDSDDWYDGQALLELLGTLRNFIECKVRVDLVVTNYVYENETYGSQRVVDFNFAIKKNKIIGWDQLGHFGYTQNLLMHSLCYRVDVLRADGGLPMPAHTFYVDNIYAYVPLPRVKTLYYLDVNLYRYFIGREDQSVNESVMISRLDQQFRVTDIMIKSHHLYDVESSELRAYMLGYITLMMAICTVFAKLSGKPEDKKKLRETWAELKEFDLKMYRHARWSLLGILGNIPSKVGDVLTTNIYKAVSKVVKFN